MAIDLSVKGPMNNPGKQLPSERNFGFLFGVVFAALSGYAIYVGSSKVVIYGWSAAALAVGLISLIAPTLLTPFNKAWFLLGEMMGKVVSPLVLGAIFFILLTPIALLGRLFGRDELRLKKQPVSTYWIDRNPVGPASDSFKNQF